MGNREDNNKIIEFYTFINKAIEKKFLDKKIDYFLNSVDKKLIYEYVEKISLVSLDDYPKYPDFVEKIFIRYHKDVLEFRNAMERMIAAILLYDITSEDDYVDKNIFGCIEVIKKHIDTYDFFERNGQIDNLIKICVRNRLNTYAGENPFFSDLDSAFIQKRLFDLMKKEKNLDENQEENLQKIVKELFAKLDSVRENYKYFEDFYIYKTKSLNGGVDIGKEIRRHSVTVEHSLYAIRKASEQASKASEQASKASEQANDVANQVNKVIKDAEKDINNTVNNSIVSVLAIFAGIIIAVVGSFIYSSSVLSNILYVDMYKLIFTCLAVGFVFINIIFIMFYYIDMIRNKKYFEEKNKKIGDTIKEFITHHILITILDFVFVLILMFFSFFYKPVDLHESAEQKSNKNCCGCINLEDTVHDVTIEEECNCLCHFYENVTSQMNNTTDATENITEGKTEIIETEPSFDSES